MERPTSNVFASQIIADFNNQCKKINQLLLQTNEEKPMSIAKKLEQKLAVYQSDGVISVAFVGQYSAGKSTIISALTGRRDIKIDADIATDKATSYTWNGIKITDTPGLFTERQDHDLITYEAIAKADLLVFCLTSMLFDSITVDNFKKLAYEKGYRWKIMLVINKMSDEAGNDDEKIVNYRQSLTEAIKPYSLDEFPISFIDAKDYCEGVDNADDFLMEISRFDTFTTAINKFISERRSLARLDTPVRMTLESIDDAEITFRREENEDAAFFEILNKLSRTVNLERERLRTKVENILLVLYSDITNEGVRFASRLEDDDFDSLNKQAQANINTYCELANNNIEILIKEAVNSIQSQIQGVLEGDLAQAFFNRFQTQRQFFANNANAEAGMTKIFNQVKGLLSFAERVGLNPISLATREGLLNTYQGGSFRAIDVAGSNLHHVVRNLGEFLGYRFRPWEAVTLAKNIANFTQTVGGILGGIAVVAQFHSAWQEQEQEKKLAEARKAITSEFIKIANQITSHIHEQVSNVEIGLYEEIEKNISNVRNQQRDTIEASSIYLTQLSEIRATLENLLQDIRNASTRFSL